MPYHKPTGRELQALKMIRSKVQLINDAQGNLSHYAKQFMEDPGHDDPCINTWQITTDHALGGVRCNGTQDTTTLSDVIHGVRRIRKRRAGLWREFEAELRKLDALLHQVESVIVPFKLCKACKGRKGAYFREGKHGLRRWNDCVACDGRGIEDGRR